MDPNKKKLLEELRRRKRPQSLNERYSSMLQHHRERSKSPSKKSSTTKQLTQPDDPVPSTSKAAMALDMENLNIGNEESIAAGDKPKRKEKKYPLHHNLLTDEVAPDIFPMEPAAETIYDARDLDLIVQEKK